MRTRLAGTVLLSTVVFFVVSVLVSVGVLWWSGDVALGILIGVICGSGRLLRSALFSGPWGERGNAPATNTSDHRMEMIAEQGMPLRNTMLLFYSP
jgi:hypothetical protein